MDEFKSLRKDIFFEQKEIADCVLKTHFQDFLISSIKMDFATGLSSFHRIGCMMYIVEKLKDYNHE